MSMWRLPVLFGLMTAAAQAGQAPLLPALPPMRTLEDLDKALANVRSFSWTIPRMAGFAGPDANGATLEADLARHVMTDNTLAEMDRLRAEVQKAIPAGSVEIPRAALAPLERLLASEVCRMMSVAGYWQLHPTRIHHDNLIQALIDRLPETARAKELARLRELDARIVGLHQWMSTTIEECAKENPFERLAATPDPATPVFVEFNQLRQQIARSEYLRPAPPLPVNERTAPCPPAAAPGPRRSVLSRPDLAALFPEEAVQYQVEGAVRVGVEYDAGGCVVRTSVMESSGAEILDKAATEYGFGLFFQPAEEDGKAVGGTVVAPIAFSLKDLPAP